jgi:hypothetical protein
MIIIKNKLTHNGLWSELASDFSRINVISSKDGCAGYLAHPPVFWDFRKVFRWLIALCWLLGSSVRFFGELGRNFVNVREPPCAGYLVHPSDFLGF